MAAGKPLVTFDLAETRFSAQDSALYVGGNDEKEFAVQIARLMDEPSVRRKLGWQGQNRIRTELAWQYSVPKLLNVYDALKIPGGFKAFDDGGTNKPQQNHAPNVTIGSMSQHR